MEHFKVGQLTKELVAIQLKRMEDPCAAAADSVAKTLRVALKGVGADLPQRGKVIEDAVRGGMQGLLLAEQSVPRGGALVIEAMADLAQDLGLDPQDTLKSALTGLASLKHLLRPDQLDGLREELDAHFHGTGAVFSELLDKQKDPSQAPRPADAH